MTWKNDLTKKIETKSAVIGILGLGYVGLPLMSRFSEESFKVIGFDVDQDKVDKLNQGKSYIRHIPDQLVQQAQNSGFVATTDMSRAKEADALILCVPTPLNQYREPDLSFVLNTVEAVIPHMRKGQVLSLESTTYPGTTEEELFPRLEKAGFSVGEDTFLVYSPEREDPGNSSFSTKTIPKICGGHTKNCLDIGVTLYQSIIEKVVPVSSTKAAEMTKLLENIHRAVNIGLVNELKIVADKMGIDIHEVIDAAATKPFGFTAYYPGPGLGGHCIPIDPFYLTWKAREYSLHTRFIELAGEINSNMPEWVITKTTDALNHIGKPVKNSRILILGIAYKKNVDDMRESPSIELIDLLTKKEAIVDYSDPYVPIFPKTRKHHFDLSSIVLTPDSLASYDCVILATNHDAYDYDLIRNHAKLIIDTRGVYKNIDSHIIKA